MSLEHEANGAASWRRRHPILSRSLLYGAGAVLVALAAVLLVRRGDRDRQDRLDLVRARLDGLDLVASRDATGDVMGEVLAEVFAEPDLPADLRQRALRAQAIQHLKRGAEDAALSDLDAAAELATSPADRDAIRLERVQVLIVAARPAEARAALAAAGPPSHPALAVWRSLLDAQILGALEQPDAAIRALDHGLEALPRPLPNAEPVIFSLTPWTPSEAAIQATRSLADLAGGPLGPEAWERLLELAPRDFLAAMEAAKALRRGGHTEKAARAWAWAVSLNGGQPPAGSALDPDLAVLEKKRVEGLKAEVGGGR